MFFSLSVALSALALVRGDSESFVRVTIGPNSKLVNSDGVSSELVPPHEHHRGVRRPNTCKFPTVLNDSQLDCKLYPSKVECVQTCMFGHTLSDGIQRVMKCRYDEDRWTPIPEFEKCLPFVDCAVTLGPGGKYKCHTNFMDKGTVCEISCSHYEDKAAVAPAQYQCQIDGNWTPKLPFCAKSGTGAQLVPSPSGPKLAFPK